MVNATFKHVCQLIKSRQIRVSAHGYAQFAKRGILASDITTGALQGEAIEDYPEAHYGPSVLILQTDPKGKPVHVVWGIEKGTTGPAVIVTAYYPNPAEWTADFRSRK